ncbi:MAG: PDZ domain-containing protein [Phycisphaeraceae bacterium]|nr:PDZ domain-containing protein [Phycisphaerales bacterium]QOJ18905.1 MAG: PDZ domain-containing protein [Phycisphaeraceae bacterium]
MTLRRIALAHFHRTIALFASAAVLATGLGAGAQSLPDNVLKDFAFREIGPTVFGGRITDLSLVEGRPHTIFVAAASGGLFRTTNNGTTWECIFQHEGTISIGDIAVDQKNPDTIWVGTGEANNQRSSYWGDGVYKTTDGGKTWTNVGLRDSHHIARIAIDPSNSDVVYVAAMGRLYSDNEERGLFKTADGGKTWQRVLWVSERVGATEVAIDPRNPSTVYAATYERIRRPWHLIESGPGSAIWKSTDAGATWTRLAGGLPSGDIGRIGLAIYPKNPDIVYATVADFNPAPQEQSAARPMLGFWGDFTDSGFRVTTVTENSNAARAGLQVGDVISRLAGEEMTSVWNLIRALGNKTPADEIEIVYTRDGEERTIRMRLGAEPPRAQQGQPRIVGGSIYRSNDGGATWTKQNTRPIGGDPPYYYGQIRVAPTDENRIYVLGVPMYASDDGGKTWNMNAAASVHVDHHALEIGPGDLDRLVLGNDGGLAISYDRGATWDHYNNIPLAQFYTVAVDMQIPYHIYGGTQDNGTWGGPSVSKSFRGIGASEWYRVGGGDGFYAQIDPFDSNIVFGESQFGVIFRLDKRTWQSRSIRPPQTDRNNPDRYNWSSPILMSTHNPGIIYFGGNKLFKSWNRGDTWPQVSPDLTTADAEKIKGNVPHCTITTIAESPIDPNLLLVGTDDGLVQMSQDGGITWTNLAGRFPGAPSNWWVSRVELSRHDVNVAYVSFTGYREDDFRPFIYATRNKGQNWELISGGLPHEPVNVIREDPRNPNVLWVGTDLGCHVSIDRGATWTRLKNGLPTIAVHDLVIHPRDRDLALGTHGRGFFIVDIGPIQELSAEVLGKPAHLFTIEDAYQWNFYSNEGWSGNRLFNGPNGPYGAAVSYHLKSAVERGAITLTIRDASGRVIRSLEAPTGQGLHRVYWNFQGDPAPGAAQGGGQPGGRRGGRAQTVPPGTYTAVLKVGDQEFTQSFEVKRDPMLDRVPGPVEPEPAEAEID